MTALALHMEEPRETWDDFASAFDITSLDLARRRGTKRKAIEAVDHLIALLDALDVDTEDREDDEREPDLAFDFSARRTNFGLGGGCEHLVDDSEEGSDFEPSLGSLHDFDQRHWSDGLHDDREDEHDGREAECGYDLPEGDDERCASDDVDGEPTLGVPENHDEAPDQERWGQGGFCGSPEPEADELDPMRLRVTRSWETVEADRRVAEAVARRAVTMRRRKQGVSPLSVFVNTGAPNPVKPGRLTHGPTSTLRLLMPGDIHA